MDFFEIIKGESNLLNLIQVSPILVLLLTGCVLMLLEAFKVRGYLAHIAGGGIILSIVLALPPVMSGFASAAGFEETTQMAFAGMIRTDGMASLVHIFLAVSGLFTLFFLGDFLKRQDKPINDVYALIAFCLVGMSLLANANDLIITFIGLETMSICLYIMAGLFKKDLRSNEAGLKYFLLGAFAAGFFIYGIALLYGASGSTNFSEMNFGAMALSPLFYPGMALLIIGFLFKVAAFPFHAWTPDVYTGSPTPLAGFMATGSKAAAFIALATFFQQNPALYNDSKLVTVLAVVAVLTMIYGNIVAAQQSNLKRLLAYSSIAHAGYVLLAVAAGSGSGQAAVIFYMLIYTLMNIGAFGMLSMAEAKFEDNNMDSWRGLGIKDPWFGAGLSLFLLSLAGIPPLAGFMGKYFVFAAAIDSGLMLPAVIGILTSVIGAFYYIRVIQLMYFNDKDEPTTRPVHHLVPVVGVVLLAVLVLVFGIFPGVLQEFMGDTVMGFAVR